MAEYGFLAYNLNNSVVIDSKFINYVYRTSGTTSLNAGINYINLPNTNDKVIFAFRPTTRYVAHWGYKFTSSTLTHARVVVEAPCSLQWVMFQEVPIQVPTNTYGILIFNENGKPVFSSEEKYLKMHKDYKANVNQTITPTSITNYFVTWSPIVKTEWEYIQIRDEATTNCITTTYTQRAAVTKNIKRNYCVGIKKSGSNILTNFILHNTEPAVLNPTLKYGTRVTCSNGYDRKFYGGISSDVRVLQTDDQMEFSEILDPLV
jgi:hypothetical protein